MERWEMRVACIIAWAMFFGAVANAGVEVDDRGARKTRGAPAPGVHPRVFFTEEEIPDLKRRMNESWVGQNMTTIVEGELKRRRASWEAFAELDLSDPTPEQVAEYFKPDPKRNVLWGCCAVLAIARDDVELRELMIDTISNYARIVLASKEMALVTDLNGETGKVLNERFKVWRENDFGTKPRWSIGDTGIAVCYDLLYNDMTPKQRDIVRKAIAVGIKGRSPWGVGNPRGRAISNFYGYQSGELYVLQSAIEGEKGYDKGAHEGIRQVLIDYWEVGFTPNGACHEDLYGPTLGLREGTRGFAALAKRGYNAFASDRYKNYVEYFAQEMEPGPDGRFVGGASGGPGLPYPTTVIMMKHQRPNDPFADYVWRHYVGDGQYVGDDFAKRVKWQGWLDCMLFGTDYERSGEPNSLESSGAKLTAFYPRRGKLITRNDLSPESLYFQLDARPDAWCIGHDTVDRGHFNLCAHGRPWTMRGSWHHFRNSDDHNLVHIDGKAQGWQAPSVKFLKHKDNGKAVTAVADLKYAYDWKWTSPWPTKDAKWPTPWEKETSNPRDLGWPDNPDWLPETLYHDDIGHVGLYLWRHPYNPVTKAFRSTIMVRGKHPYVIIVDDVKKDDKPHTYDWRMQLPTDVKMIRQNGNDVILGETNGNRRLLVRILQADDASGKTPPQVNVEVASYQVNVDKKTRAEIMGNRLIVAVDSVDPKFKIMLYPFRDDEPLPETKLVGGKLTVKGRDTTDSIAFTPTETGATEIALTSQR